MSDLYKNFSAPENKYSPRLRYWWPAGYVAHHLDELDQEIKSIAKAGFGGFEISDVYDGLTEEQCSVLVPETYGFTSEYFKKSVKQAFVSAKEAGISVDLTVGPHWPASTNEATPNDVGTAKELCYGTFRTNQTIKSGQAVEELCSIHYKTSESLIDGSPIHNQLIALYLAEHLEYAEVEMPPAVPWEEPYTVIKDQIVYESLTLITEQVSNGVLSNDIEVTKDSILIAVYQRGTGQRVNMFSMGSPNRPDVMNPYAYVVDHFSKDGAQWIISLWENQVLDDELRGMIRETGDCFFEDSLELQSVGHWTDTMLEDFERIKGYSILPYLPFILGINQDKGIAYDKTSFQVEDANAEKISKFRHDFFEVLNILYRENHLQVVKDWAHGYGMKYRAQPYGWAIDSARVAADLDIVEGESLGFGEDGIDAFRMLAAGRSFGGVEILSDEAGAYLFQGYATTLQQLFSTLHKNYMGGVNQTYWHGLPFKYAPQAKWPGFAAFTPMLGGRGFAEPWGERQPVWSQMPTYTTYLSRVHYILRQGKQAVDVLLLGEGHNASEHKSHPLGQSLVSQGYSCQIMTEGLFELPAQVVSGRLEVAGGYYKALIVPENVELQETSQKILSQWQAKGLPILQNISQLQSVLGISDYAGKLFVRRYTDTDEFIIFYNPTSKIQDLFTFFAHHQVEEWSPWTGKKLLSVKSDLAAEELRIFKIIGKGHTDCIVYGEAQPLSARDWTVTVDAWKMKSPETMNTLHEIKEVKLEEPVAWSSLNGLEHASGTAVYRGTVSCPQIAQQLLIPRYEGSLQVFWNGVELVGNALLGIFDLPNVKELNTLEIHMASTLNNYLNACPLADYYGKYAPQIYGLAGGVWIR